MDACVRAGCGRPALAAWWRLCASCTLPLMAADANSAQSNAAGWEALTWAERIAPSAWGNANHDDPWVIAARCLTFASVGPVGRRAARTRRQHPARYPSSTSPAHPPS